MPGCRAPDKAQSIGGALAAPFNLWKGDSIFAVFLTRIGCPKWSLHGFSRTISKESAEILQSIVIHVERGTQAAA
jgi:hypothetical protein